MEEAFFSTNGILNRLAVFDCNTDNFKRSETMEIRFYLRMLQRGWWLILISALVAVNLSLVYSYFVVVPQFEAVARFIVSPNIQNIESRDLVNSLEALDKRSIISTYAEVLNSPQIFKGTVELLNQDPANFTAYTTAVTVLPEANIIRFSVRGPNPDVAVLLANNVGQYAIDYVRTLYVIYDIDFLDKAVTPTEPFEPRPAQDAGMALLLGIVIGVGLAVFRDQLSSTLDRLKQRRMIDNESQAFTREYFEQRIRQEIAGNPDDVVTLGIIHLNGIHETYDSLPQAYINKIMRQVTEALRYQLRGNDLIGRWSPLEFGVLLTSTNGGSAKRTLSRVLAVLDQKTRLDVNDGLEVRLDPRVGLADRQGGESLPVLIDQARQALEISMQSDEKVSLYGIRPFG